MCFLENYGKIYKVKKVKAGINYGKKNKNHPIKKYHRYIGF